MRRLIGAQSVQPIAITWRTIEPRDYFLMSFVTLGIGGIGTLIGSVGSYKCPLNAVGLACPGCGCGRAVTTFFQSGPIKMYEAQPTAGALVMVIGLLFLSLPFLHLQNQSGRRSRSRYCLGSRSYLRFLQSLISYTKFQMEKGRYFEY